MYLSDQATRMQDMLDAQDGRKLRWGVERLDPRARLGGAVVLGTASVLSPSMVLAVAWLLVGLGALLASSQGRVRPFVSLNAFMACVWISLPLTVEGIALWQWGPFSVSAEGVHLASLLTLKANASLAFLLALCGSMGLGRAGLALQGMGAPRHLLTFFLLFCRYLGTLGSMYHSSLNALHLRGRGLGCGRRLYVFACLVGSVLVHAADEAERVRLAMLCKRGGLRYDVSQLRWQRCDTSFCLGAGVLCLCLYGAEVVRYVAHQ